MDLFLKLDEYLSKPLEGIKSRISKCFNEKILTYRADEHFCMDHISQELNDIEQGAFEFYENWLTIIRDSSDFFVGHHWADFLKVIDNIGDKNKTIIQEFVSDLRSMLDRKMMMENLAEVGRDTLVEWITEF